MIVPGSTNLSDDSDDDDNMENEVIDKYPKKYKLLLERCEILQQDNERLVHRIQQVRKLLRRSRKERKFLMDRLDQHGDGWRNVPLPVSLDQPLSAATPIKQEKVAYAPSTKDNERLVHRIQQVRKLLRRSRKERKFLMDRLDQHGDGWRNVPLPVSLDQPLSAATPIKQEKVAYAPSTKDNERLVHRIQQVRKLLRRSRKERKFLMDRLDQHGDGWRNVPLPVSLDQPLSAATPIKQEKVAYAPSTKTVGSSEKPNRKSTGGNTPRKRKSSRNSDKAERDPNTPKRPANPFFPFCQEQRPIVMERLGLEQKVGEPETSKQELTRQLASKWNTLPPEDKKVYYDMYEKSKEKYTAELQIYTSRAKPPAEKTASN